MNGARIAETSLMRANDERAEFCRAGQDIGDRSGNIAWGRLRESNTRHPRYEGGALPSELSRRKIDKWPAAALPQSKATLQQGLPLRAERAPLANSGRSRCQTAKLPRSPKRCVSTQRVVCTQLSRGSRHARRVTIDRRHADTRASERGRCARREGENLCVRELCRAIRSLLPVRRRGLARRRLIRLS